jgi:hypothetical protein
MGYGLRSDVPALVNRDRQFDIVPDHYRAFSLEPGPNSSMDLNVYVPPQNARFGTFLELIQQLNTFANQETVLVVNHGMSDQNGDPLGLILPLTSGSAWNPEEYSLGLLAGFIAKTPSDAEYADKEKNSSMETAQHQKIPMPAGTLKPLDIALRALRAKKLLKRLELRACNLGGNPTVMKLLAQVLGLDAMVAPQVHMFYLRLTPPGPLPSDSAGFANWQRNHRQARIFSENVASNPRHVGIQVIGRHSARTMDFSSDSIDAKWFVDKFVCPGNNYVPRTSGRDARVSPFSFSGMDVGNSFVLAQEDDYANQLVEVTP